MSDRRTYRFGPVERGGFLGPVRAGQAAIMLAGALAGLVLLGSSPSPLRAAGAVALVALAVGVTTVSVGGGTIEQWLPVVTRWLLRRVSGTHAYRSAVPTAGVIAGDSEDALARIQPLPLPTALKGVRLVALPYGRRQVGAITQRRGRFVTAVLACRVVSFSLLDAKTQERSLSHWGSVLSACADTPVRRVQWLERTLPAERDGLARWLNAERDPKVRSRGGSMIDSYLQLIDRNVSVSHDHEALIAIQVDANRVRARGRDAVAGALLEETHRVADGLRRAGVRVHGALTAGHLSLLFRTAFDPYLRVDLTTARLVDSDRDAVADGHAWPSGAVEGWDHYRTDGAVHSCFWISGWPRVDVGALFLDPLLSDASVLRTVAVTFEPVAAGRSIRDVEAQVTRDQADHALRARFGQAETARVQQEYSATRRREAELAAGYGEVRFAGFITVTAPNLDELESARAEIKRDAARSRLELQAMYGQQAHAFTFTLPLCRGLR
jgi:hypothetical protein